MMSIIKRNYSLKKHNTFNIDVKAKYFTIIQNEKQIFNLLQEDFLLKEKILILGSGSNILFTKNYNGIVVFNQIKGIKIIEEDEKCSTIKVGAGEKWHDFVLWSIKRNLSGIENLALIPGLVGASPIQNIGAYGMEVKNTIQKIHFINIKSKKKIIINDFDCKFKYRDSIFKNQLRDKVIITNVIFKLYKKPINNIKYGEISNELQRIKKDPSPKSIAQAVINIRNKKIPNPKKIGNSGSFFKNPIVSQNKFMKLKNKFPDIVYYKNSSKKIKLAAGWLIEHAGLKGIRKGDAGVHKNQALVLVNHNNANGKEILSLARYIQKIIKIKYDINLETEVNII